MSGSRGGLIRGPATERDVERLTSALKRVDRTSGYPRRTCRCTFVHRPQGLPGVDTVGIALRRAVIENA